MRFTLAIVTTATIALASAPAEACCLTDWLFGRTASPYAVGYAPYSAGYTPYSVGYAPVGAPQIVSAPVAAPVWSSGAYQAQRPAYINNPSVYTGMPVTGNVQTTYRVAAPAPITTTTPLAFRGQAAPITSYRPQLNSSIPGQPLTITTPTGTPPSAIPTTPVAPLFQPVAPRPVGPIRGFFSRLFGTGYRTSYYRAPVTYYRPVTTVDPVTGSTVTVQRPCTSTIQQVQRTPITTFQSMQPAYGAPAAACPTPNYGYSQIAPSNLGTANYGIGQVGAVGTMGQGATQIPSTMAPSSYGTGGGYNMTPLQGAPSAAGNGDYAPMDQPRLESQSPPSNGNGVGNGNSNGSSESAPSNYWQLQNAEDSTAMIRREPIAPRGRVEPIAAPEDYVSPFRSRSAPAATTPQPPAGTFQAPPLPERTSIEPAELTAVSTRVQAQKPVTVRQTKRDSTWYPVSN